MHFPAINGGPAGGVTRLLAREPTDRVLLSPEVKAEQARPGPVRRPRLEQPEHQALAERDSLKKAGRSVDVVADPLGEDGDPGLPESVVRYDTWTALTLIGAPGSMSATSSASHRPSKVGETGRSDTHHERGRGSLAGHAMATTWAERGNHLRPTRAP